MAALGKVSSGNTAVILCTELAPSITKRDYCHPQALIADYYVDGDPIRQADRREFHSITLRSADDEKALPSFFGFDLINFGIVHIQTASMSSSSRTAGMTIDSTKRRREPRNTTNRFIRLNELWKALKR